MRKALLVLGIGYTVISIGFGLYMLTNPEAYGAWQGRFITGLCEALEKEED